MVITSGSSGIGLATAEAAAEARVNLVLAARGGETLDPSIARAVPRYESKPGHRFGVASAGVSAYVAPMDIQTLVDDFARRLQSLIENDVIDRARSAVAGALGANGVSRGFKARRKIPTQFCPVPGCKNKAAPVFGMVCAEHKSVPKAKIKKYREARRAKKLKASA